MKIRADARTFVLLGLGLGSLVGWSWILYETNRHLYPGQWSGNRGMLASFDTMMVTFWLLCAGLFLCYKWKRPWAALGLISTLAIPAIYKPPSPLIRAKSELPEYRRAIQTNTRFGDQFLGKVDEKSVTFWRWATYDVDNGIGIVYDVTDTFDQNEQSVLYYGDWHDLVFMVTRLERGYFLVTFT